MNHNLFNIEFEGKRLSIWTSAISVAATSEWPKPLSEDSITFFFAFTTCRGRSRFEKSDVILKCADELVEFLNSFVEVALKIIEYSFGPFTEEQHAHLILAAWLSDLHTMMGSAKSQKQCSWRGDDEAGKSLKTAHDAILKFVEVKINRNGSPNSNNP